jgi:flagellin-like hook-associated protein FlgL
MTATIHGSTAIGGALSTSRIAQRDTDISVTRLSTGKRIQSATDDAAGLNVSSRLRSTVMGLRQAIQNVMEFNALLTTADGALDQVQNNLQRVRELSVQSANGTLTSLERDALNAEAESLLNQINQIALNTTWNESKLLDGSFRDKYVQAGAQSSDNFKVTIPSSALGEIFDYATTFVNGDFSDTAATQSGSAVTLAGWKIQLEQVKLGQGTTLGSSTIAGYPTPIDSTPLATGSGGQISAGDDAAPSSASYTYSLSNQQTRLVSTMQTAAGGDVVHGPVLVSDSSVYMDSSSSISFKWRAAGGDDAYDVYAYLLNVDDGSTIQLLNETGTGTSDTGWQTVNMPISRAGNYKFVFVSGTFDYSFGRAAGASLYIDDVSVNGTSSGSAANVKPSDVLSLSSQSGSSTAISKIDAALAKILASRANIAANQSRLHYVAEQATRFNLETERSLSTIEDTNYEAEYSYYSKAQLLAQSANAALKKAQEDNKNVLQYIEGNRINVGS